MYLLAQFTSIIKLNTQLKREYIDIPYSKLIEKCLIILLNEGYILSFFKKTEKYFRVYLKYYKGKSVINNINCISLPGYRKYLSYNDLLKFYGLTDLVILSTSKGVISNFDLVLKSQKKKRNKTTLVVNSLTKDLIINSHIKKSLYMEKPFINKLTYGLNQILFHKKIVLFSFYRNFGIFNKISKNQYLRNKVLKHKLLKYVNSALVEHKNKNLDFLNNLVFFKFKQFFRSSNYLLFSKNDNFCKYILKVNKMPYISIFYFLFYLKQLNFSKYKYRFSLYLKYINHLILIQKEKKSKLDKINDLLGGEPLIHVN